MTRLCYKTDEFGHLISRKDYLAKDRVVRVCIDTHEMFGAICTVKDFVVIRGYEAETVDEIKKWAKQTLIDMGVQFDGEVRPRLNNDNA